MTFRPVRACLATPVLLAATIRLAHVAFLAANDPLFRIPVVDAWFHAQQASQILEKGWLLPGTGAFWKGPLLSYVYAVLFSFLGRDAGVVAVRVLNVALGTFAVYLVARIAERLGGSRAAWIAGLAAALYGTLVFYDASLLQPPLLTVLMLAAADRLLAAEDAASPARLLALAGVFLGLATITRGEGVLAITVCAVWSLLAARRKAWPTVSPARAAALVAVPALLVVAPATIRNAVLERDPVLVSWNGGINLFVGNDPGFEQTSGNWYPAVAWQRISSAPGLLGLTRGADNERFFLRQTLHAALRAPGRAIALLARKSALLFTGYEISNNQRIYEARAKSPVLALLLWRWGFVAAPFGLAAPLIAAGLFLGGRRGARAGAPLLLLAAATAATPILVFNTARYRLPGIVVLIPVAAAGWAGAGAAARVTRRFRAPAAAGVFAVLAAVTIPGHATLPPSDLRNLAKDADRRGRPDEALEWRRKDVQLEPDDPVARLDLGDALVGRGLAAEALVHYRAVLARDDLAADWRIVATRWIARCSFDLGQYDESVAWYQKVVAADPDHPWTLGHPDFHLDGVPPLETCAIRLELSRALERAGRTAEAAAEAGRVISDCFQSDDLAGKARRRLMELASRETSGGDKGAGRAPEAPDAR